MKNQQTKILKQQYQVQESVVRLIQEINDLKQSKPKNANNEPKQEVMHNGKNLVAIHASAMNKYFTTLMTILFTEEELKSGLIIEKGSKSKRDALDNERVNKLKEALFIKYNVPELKREIIWKSMSEVAKRKCRDSDKSDKSD